MKEKAFVSFVVQVERVTTMELSALERVDQFFASVFQNHEIVIVDNTGEKEPYTLLIKAAQRLSGLVSVVKLSTQRPVEIAMLAGVDKAIGDYIFQMQALILDFDFTLLEQIFKTCARGTDIVFASPSEKVPATSKLFYALFNRLSHITDSLKTDRIVLASKRALNAVVNTKQRFRYQKALLALSGFSREWVEYQPLKEQAVTKRSFGRRVQLAVDLFIAYSTVGVRIGFVFSALFLAFSIAIGTFAIYSFVSRQNILSGWTSLMLFLSVSFTGLFFLLGIVSEYLRHILLETQGTPLYIVESFHTAQVRNQFRMASEAPQDSEIPNVHYLQPQAQS
jgi:polyisoprenyl-phosphate glycosyltransferase